MCGALLGIKEEGREEGRVVGFVEGEFQTLCRLVKRGRLALEEAAEEARMSLEEFKEKMSTVRLE